MRSISVIVSVAIGSALHSFDVAARTTVSDYCQVTPVRSDALDYPSKHAWDLFLVLNHPAKPKNVERGSPDCSKPIGSPGTTAVWETWRNGKTEVFLQDGSEPPLWNDNSLPDEKPGVTPPEATSSTIAGASTILKPLNLNVASKQGIEVSFHDFIAKPGAHIMFSPGSNPEQGGVFNGEGGFGETRMNRATFEFIRRECLWSKEGGRRYAQAFLDKKKPLIVFPPDSMEVKAAWLDFEREQIPKERQSTYYVAEYKGKKYGLTALHIITKDTPNWFWATFHHKDAPDNNFESGDQFGQPSILQGTVWENYRLGGTQIEFETSIGKPTILSDHYVEFGFQRSSCISCHSTSTISSNGQRKASQAHAICSLTPKTDVLSPKDCKDTIGEDMFKPGTDDLRVERGSPSPEWFEEGGKLFYLQTDFVYSINFRAKKETSPPPDRCKW